MASYTYTYNKNTKSVVLTVVGATSYVYNEYLDSTGVFAYKDKSGGSVKLGEASFSLAEGVSRDFTFTIADETDVDFSNEDEVFFISHKWMYPTSKIYFTRTINYFDFSTPITKNYNLRAKWTGVVYTVTFEGWNGATTVPAEQYIRYPGYATKYNCVESRNTTVDGWSMTDTFTNNVWKTEDGQVFDFKNTIVDRNITLHIDPPETGTRNELMYVANGNKSVKAHATAEYDFTVQGAGSPGNIYFSPVNYGDNISGKINLIKDRTYYLYAGGLGEVGAADSIAIFCKPEDYPVKTLSGGYNGGGDGWQGRSTPTTGTYFSGYVEVEVVTGGGGASHIATVDGLLKNIASDSNLLVVAGGGGGKAAMSKMVDSKDKIAGGNAGSNGNLLRQNSHPTAVAKTNGQAATGTNTNFSAKTPTNGTRGQGGVGGGGGGYQGGGGGGGYANSNSGDNVSDMGIASGAGGSSFINPSITNYTKQTATTTTGYVSLSRTLQINYTDGNS